MAEHAGEGLPGAASALGQAVADEALTDNMMKIIKRANGQTELYDLDKDLYETRDLSDDPAYSEQKLNLLQLLA